MKCFLDLFVSQVQVDGLWFGDVLVGDVVQQSDDEECGVLGVDVVVYVVVFEVFFDVLVDVVLYVGGYFGYCFVDFWYWFEGFIYQDVESVYLFRVCFEFGEVGFDVGGDFVEVVEFRDCGFDLIVVEVVGEVEDEFVQQFFFGFEVMVYEVVGVVGFVIDFGQCCFGEFLFGD